LKHYLFSSKIVVTGLAWHGNADEILGISDYGVTYMQRNGTTHEKDGWNFQVRYFHQADKDL